MTYEELHRIMAQRGVHLPPMDDAAKLACVAAYTVGTRDGLAEAAEHARKAWEMCEPMEAA